MQHAIGSICTRHIDWVAVLAVCQNRLICVCRSRYERPFGAGERTRLNRLSRYLSSPKMIASYTRSGFSPMILADVD
jgi:hypothetical protein